MFRLLSNVLLVSAPSPKSSFPTSHKSMSRKTRTCTFPTPRPRAWAGRIWITARTPARRSTAPGRTWTTWCRGPSAEHTASTAWTATAGGPSTPEHSSRNTVPAGAVIRGPFHLCSMNSAFLVWHQCARICPAGSSIGLCDAHNRIYFSITIRWFHYIMLLIRVKYLLVFLMLVFCR